MTALRIVAFAFGAVLVYSLYLPSSCPPERFVEQVRREHDLNAAFWGADHAGKILSQVLDLAGQLPYRPRPELSYPPLIRLAA